MLIFLTYILFSISAILNAFMDIIENENFHSSVFKNLNQKFWYKRESWKYAYKIFGWKFDAWHVAKSLMIILITLSIIFYKPFIPVIDMIVLGVIWNVSFNTSYKLFKNSK